MLKIDGVCGVMPALVSPLLENGDVDEAAIERLVERVLAAGVHGVVPLGSTGEAASLGERQRRAVLAAVITVVDGRVPVIAGISQLTPSGAAQEILDAKRLGAAAALVVPPFFYSVDQQTVGAFYREIASTTDLPIFAYNIPQFSKVVIEPATVAALASESVLVGLKDSSRDFEYFSRLCVLLRTIPDFRLFTGADTMFLAALTMGAAGTICGSANVVPDWVVGIYDSYLRGDLTEARVHQDSLIELVLKLRPGIMPVRVKAALDLIGVGGGWPARPVARLEGKELSDLSQQLERLHLLEPSIGVADSS